MSVEVVVPEAYTGAVVGDLNSRRGKISGMEQVRSDRVVAAVVPLIEMFGYATQLRSLTVTRTPSSTGTPAFPLLIHSVCGSNRENTFSACGMRSPHRMRRRMWSICRSA